MNADFTLFTMHLLEYLQFISTVLWFWHSVTDMQLSNDLISSHAWIRIGACKYDK